MVRAVSLILLSTVESQSVMTIHFALSVKKDITSKMENVVVVRMITWELMIVMNVESTPQILLESDAILVLEIKFRQKIIELVKNPYSIVRN